MSGVLLRCPHCGTARATPGECDACHEASVRYYCTNHQPGRWLDQPSCTACGARFGEAVPAARPPRPEVEDVPHRERPAGGRPRGARPTAPRPPGAAHRPPPRRADDDFGRGSGGTGPRPMNLEDLLRAAAAHGARRAETRTRTAAPRRANPLGCLVRLLLMVFFFFLLAASGLFLFAGSMFRIF